MITVVQRLLSIAVLLFAACFSGCTDRADSSESSDPAREAQEKIARLESDMRALRSDVEFLKGQVTPKPADDSPVRDTIYEPDGSADNDPYLGETKAPLLLMAFTEYECKRCRDFAEAVLPQIKREFIDSGKLRYVLRDFPLSNHAHAVEAARFAHCAGEQGKYWDADALLLQSPEMIEQANISALMEKLPGADPVKLKRCLSSAKYLREVDLDVAEGKRLEARGAPGFFLGRRRDAKTFQGVFIRGAQPYGVFHAEIQKLLAESAASETSGKN